MNFIVAPYRYIQKISLIIIGVSLDANDEKLLTYIKYLL